MTGYRFQGWYDKKSGGSKITSNTKVKKSITYYAHWKRVLTSEEKKLVGSWSLYTSGMGYTESFNANGTYDMILVSDTSYSKYSQFTKGFWRVSGGTVYMTNLQYQTSKDGGNTFSPWIQQSTPNKTMKIKHGSDENGQYFIDLKYDVKVYKTKI